MNRILYAYLVQLTLQKQTYIICAWQFPCVSGVSGSVAQLEFQLRKKISTARSKLKSTIKEENNINYTQKVFVVRYLRTVACCFITWILSYKNIQRYRTAHLWVFRVTSFPIKSIKTNYFFCLSFAIWVYFCWQYSESLIKIVIHKIQFKWIRIQIQRWFWLKRFTWTTLI